MKLLVTTPRKESTTPLAWQVTNKTKQAEVKEAIHLEASEVASAASQALKVSKISLEGNKAGNKAELEVLHLETFSMNLKSFSVDNKVVVDHEEVQEELLQEAKTLFCKWK